MTDTIKEDKTLKIPQCPICHKISSVDWCKAQGLHYCFDCDCFVCEGGKIINHDSKSWKPISPVRARRRFLDARHEQQLASKGILKGVGEVEKIGGVAL